MVSRKGYHSHCRRSLSISQKHPGDPRQLEGIEGHASGHTASSLRGVLIQIMLLDIVFSLDSVITAIGMANQLIIMVLAVVMAVIFMMFSSGSISGFVEKHPTIKVLALSFLL